MILELYDVLEKANYGNTQKVNGCPREREMNRWSTEDFRTAKLFFMIP